MNPKDISELTDEELNSEQWPKGVKALNVVRFQHRIDRMAVQHDSGELVLWDHEQPDDALRLKLDGTAVKVSGTFEFKCKGVTPSGGIQI